MCCRRSIWPAWLVLYGSAYGIASLLGLPFGARLVFAAIFWPAVFFALALVGTGIEWIRDRLEPLRIRSTLREIGRLDAEEAPDPAFDRAFERLRRFRAERVVPAIARRGESRKSQRWFLEYLGGSPEGRAALQELGSVDEPVGRRAREILVRSAP